MIKQYQNKEWLEGKYLGEKLRIIDIANKSGVNEKTIRRWLKKLKIRKRDKNEIYHLYNTNHFEILDNIKDFIDGEVFADGCIKKISPYSARFEYTSKYLEYINFISNTLDSFGIKQSGKINKFYHKKFDCYSYHYCSLTYQEFLQFYERWYPNNGKKIIPKDINFSPLMLHQAYIGDGHLTHQRSNKNPYIQLGTYSFLPKDLIWVISQLNDIGIKATLRPSSNTIAILTHSTKNFLNYIGRPKVNCYKYKFQY